MGEGGWVGAIDGFFNALVGGRSESQIQSDHIKGNDHDYDEDESSYDSPSDKDDDDD